MKKILSVVVVFAMLAAATTAFAAAPETTKNANGSYTTSGSDENYANKMMTILAYTEGQPIGVNSIQYIDQTTANASGEYSFPNYAPKAEPTGSTRYVVKVGGQGIATPLDAGYIEADSSAFTVSGTLTVTGTLTPATVTLSADGKDDVVVEANATDGTFTASVEAGTYTLTAAKVGHTKAIQNGLAVAADVADLAYVLKEGDANGDGVIGVPDIVEIVSGLGQDVTSENKATDVNDDGVIGVPDIVSTISNLGAADTVIE